MRRLIFISIFLSLSANVYSQNETQITSEEPRLAQNEKFEKLRDQLDFTDTEKAWKLKEWDKEIDKEKEDEIKMPRSSGLNFNGGITNIFAYLLIILLIMAVIYMIFNSIKIDKKITESTISDDRIEDIEAVDTLDGFKLALQAGDYRSAIRMQFIKVLQLLQENKHINWRPEKTNKDYLRELSGTDQKSKFRHISGIYELVWYGNTNINKEIFEQLNPSFDTFINGFNEK